MELAKNSLLKALNSGRKQIGLWISLANHYAAEVTAHAGFDWVVIDMEHSPNDYFSVLGQLQAFGQTNTTPIVRVEWNNAVAVKRLLDLGTPGILFPMIQNVEEARQAVASTRYPPDGVRGVSASTRATKFGRVSNYTAQAADEIAVFVQLETRAAIEQAEAIAQVDGVSGVFFGPADIAADIGKVGKPLDDEVWQLILPTARKLIDQRIPVGTLVMSPEFAVGLFDQGFSFVACGTDAALLASAADRVLAQVKEPSV